MNSQTIVLAILVILILLIGAGVAIVLYTQKRLFKFRGPAGTAVSTSLKKEKLRDSIYLYIYNQAKRLPYIGQQLLNTERQFASLGLLTIIQARQEATKIWTIMKVLQVVAYVVGLLVTSDITAALLFVLLFVVIEQSIINKRITKIYERIYIDLNRCIADIRTKYQQTNDIVESVTNIGFGTLMYNTMNSIREILVEPNAHYHQEQFDNSVQLPQLLTLLQLCYHTYVDGDSKRLDGQMNFLYCLDSLTSEINIQLRLQRKSRVEFSGTEMVSLYGLVFYPIATGLLMSSLPQLKVFLGGAYGIIARAVILIVTIVCYDSIVSSMKKTVVEYDDRKPWVLKALTKGYIYKALQFLMPVKDKTLNKAQRLLKESLSRYKVDQYYFLKYVYAFAAMLLTTVIVVVAMFVGHYNLKNSIVPSSMGSEYSVEEIDLLTTYEKGVDTSLSEAELMQELQSIFPRYSTTKLREEVKRIKDKADALDESPIKFYYLWLIALAGFLAYKLPTQELNRRRKAVAAEMRTDVLQLQTVIVMLMHNNMDTNALCRALYKQSSVQKHLLVDAYNSLNSDPRGTLEYLKSRSSTPEMKVLVDKLILTIRGLSIAEAFSDVSASRNHMLILQEQEGEEVIRRRRHGVSKFMKAPMNLTIVLGVIVPIAVYASTLLKDVFSQLGGL